MDDTRRPGEPFEEEEPLDLEPEPFEPEESFEFEVEEPAEAEKPEEPAPPKVEEPVPAPPPAERERVFAGTGVRWGFMFGILLTVAVIVLAAQNTQSVRVSWLVWDWRAPLVVIILAAALAAAIIDELVGLMWRRRRRRVLTEKEELRRLRDRSRAEQGSGSHRPE